jgi:DNA-directed RNA polymerase specialized sigma24 family protein
VARSISTDSSSGDLLLVASGDDAALERLLDRWRQPLYALFERTREPSAAAEAAAEVFADLMRSAPRYDPARPFAVHLWGLAARQLHGRLAAPVAAIPTARLRESASARTAFLRSAVSALPPAERTAFLLTRVVKLPVPTAAAAVGISEAELKRRLVRAFERLQESLQPLLEMPAEAAGNGSGETEETLSLEGGSVPS